LKRLGSKEPCTLSRFIIFRKELGNTEFLICLLSAEDIEIEDTHSDSMIPILRLKKVTEDFSLQIDFNKPCLFVINKIDRVSINGCEGKLRFNDRIHQTILISLKEDKNTDLLINELKSQLKKLISAARPDSELFTIRERHKNCLETIISQLSLFLESPLPLDIRAHMLRDALYTISELIGGSSSEEINNLIFNEFCIGK